MRSSKPLFELGEIVTAKTVSESLEPKKIASLIRNHITGDFGVLCNEDIEANKQAIEQGEWILSAYNVNGGSKTVLIVTESDRSHTTILFADEYELGLN